MRFSAPGLSPALVAQMSIATGLAVASHDSVQPPLATIAQILELSCHRAGFIVATAQSGYAARLSLGILPARSVTGRLGGWRGRLVREGCGVNVA